VTSEYELLIWAVCCICTIGCHNLTTMITGMPHEVNGCSASSFSSSFMNTTNNRLERLNGQLKQVINRNSSLEDFLEKLYVVPTSLCNEYDYKVALQFQKVPVSQHERGSPQQLYSTLLTTYATKFVLKQLEMQTKIADMVPLQELQSFCIPNCEGNLQVSPFEWPCIFHCAMGLPSRHIFAVRRKPCMTLPCAWTAGCWPHAETRSNFFAYARRPEQETAGAVPVTVSVIQTHIVTAPEIPQGF